MSFMMPATYTLETLPAPEDPRSRCARCPPADRRGALLRVLERERYLATNRIGVLDAREGPRRRGRTPMGPLQLPFPLWFLRRNEILIPVAGNF